MMISRFQIKNLWLLLLIVSIGNLQAEDLVARIFTDPNGQTLPYRLLIPADYDKDKKYPVVLFFHGAGERGADNKAQLKYVVGTFTIPENRAKYPCFVIAPQCPSEQQWVNMPWGSPSGKRPATPSQSMQLALKILDALTTEFNVDLDRIYVTGMSMGGYGTWDCLTRFPERFAAAIPLCGGGDEKTVTEAAAKVPVWTFHSADDPIVPVIRTRHMVKAMIQAGGYPHYTEYDAKLKLGHDCWEMAYKEPDLLPWLFAQRRSEPDPRPPVDAAASPADNSPPADSTNHP